MRHPKLFACLLAQIAFLSVSPAAFADSDKSASLTGLAPLRVLVERLPAAETARKIGISEATIKTDTELAARNCGIPVDDSSHTALYVLLNLTETPEHDIAYSVEVSCLTPCVIRDNRRVTLANVWKHSGIGIVGAMRYAQIRVSISDAVNEFLNDYLKANPPTVAPKLSP